jgi:hypothetical protein
MLMFIYMLLLLHNDKKNTQIDKSLKYHFVNLNKLIWTWHCDEGFF